MSVEASIPEPQRQLSVEPGRTVECTISISNTGTIVERFLFDVVGASSSWASVEPSSINLLPGQQAQATVRFAPPRDASVPSGSVPFAVKITPESAPDQSVVEEGVLTVGTFSLLSAELLPRVATGRRSGRQRLAVDNRGNTLMPVGTTIVDPEDALRFTVRPQRLNIPPGEAAFARITIRPRKRFWRGPALHKPYKVHVVSEEEKPVVLDGTFNQLPLVPKYSVAALVLAGLLVAAWFLLVKPQIKSNADDAVASNATVSSLVNHTQSLQHQVDSISTTTVAPPTTVPPPSSTSTSAVTTTAPHPVIAAKNGTSTTTSTAPTSMTVDNDGRLTLVVAPGQTTQTSYTVPANETLTITDLVFQNVSGSAGTAWLQRQPTGSGSAETLFEENLGSFSEREERFTTPMVFTAGQQMVLMVECQSDQTACNEGVYYTGPVTEPTS